MHLPPSTDEPSAILSTLSANLHMFWRLSRLQQVPHIIVSPQTPLLCFVSGLVFFEGELWAFTTFILLPLF